MGVHKKVYICEKPMTHVKKQLGKVAPQDPAKIKTIVLLYGLVALLIHGLLINVPRSRQTRLRIRHVFNSV